MIKIRPGHARDIDQAVRGWLDALTARSGGAPPPETYAQRCRRTLESGGTWWLVAEEEPVSGKDGRIVGMACGMDARRDDGAGQVEPGLCHLTMVWVLPGRWGKGIGRRLMDAILQEARERRYERAQLWTPEDNERAQRLYRSCGFHPTGRMTVDELGETIGHWLLDLGAGPRPREVSPEDARSSRC